MDHGTTATPSVDNVQAQVEQLLKEVKMLREENSGLKAALERVRMGGAAAAVDAPLAEEVSKAPVQQVDMSNPENRSALLVSGWWA